MFLETERVGCFVQTRTEQNVGEIEFTGSFEHAKSLDFLSLG
jgi:hypothetical protein